MGDEARFWKEKAALAQQMQDDGTSALRDTPDWFQQAALDALESLGDDAARDHR